MRRVRRILCALLAVLLLAEYVPPRTDAANTIIFTAVNDTLLTLSDETMPFYSGSSMYVASMAFDGTDLGIYYSRSRDKTTVVVYKQRKVIIFDLAAGTIETNDDQHFSGSAITRGDIVFLPLDVMCKYFGLNYTYNRISYGYLLRIKNESAVLSDATFIDAAGAPMAQRYARYERSQTEPEQPQEQAPVVETEPPRDTAQRTLYFIAECTDAAKTELLLARLSGGRVTCLIAQENAENMAGMLRRLVSEGAAVALRVDASAGAEETLRRVEAGNRALWAAANTKTRLVWLDGASEEVTRRVSGEGYCPIGANVNLSGTTMSVNRMSTRILAAADARKGKCSVFLGTDGEASANLGTLLASLRTSNCTPARLNEVIAFQR